MALLLCSSKATNPDDTRILSTMMQSIGYILSASGPIFMGKVFEISGSWDVALQAIAFIAFLQMVMGFVVGKPGFIRG
jgi:CP family cyanate transporter-like MFS transporter